MMRYAAITSMDKKYYNHCGRAMLNSYKHYLSKSIPMYVYNEGNFYLNIKPIVKQGWNLGSEYVKFIERWKDEPKVVTFSKKGFSIIHAMETIECSRLIWLDADTIIKDTVPMQLLDLIAPPDVLSTHFSVWHIKNEKEYHSCETGFFILNKTHPGFNEFLHTYKEIYVNDKTKDLRRFYDGEVYGKTVELMEAKGYTMLNLNPGKHKTPISRSVISPYITHFKAGVKESLTNEVLEKDYIGDQDLQ